MDAWKQGWMEGGKEGSKEARKAISKQGRKQGSKEGRRCIQLIGETQEKKKNQKPQIKQRQHEIGCSNGKPLPGVKPTCLRKTVSFSSHSLYLRGHNANSSKQGDVNMSLDTSLTALESS